MLQDSANLLDGDAWKPLHELRDLSAILEILEQCGDRHPSTSEYPGTADAIRMTLDRRAARPIDHRENPSTEVLRRPTAPGPGHRLQELFQQTARLALRA